MRAARGRSGVAGKGLEGPQPQGPAPGVVLGFQGSQDRALVPQQLGQVEAQGQAVAGAHLVVATREGEASLGGEGSQGPRPGTGRLEVRQRPQALGVVRLGLPGQAFEDLHLLGGEGPGEGENQGQQK